MPTVSSKFVMQSGLYASQWFVCLLKLLVLSEHSIPCLHLSHYESSAICIAVMPSSPSTSLDDKKAAFSQRYRATRLESTVEKLETCNTRNGNLKYLQV